MNQVLLFSLSGLGNGALIAGVAIALVTFYRGAGVINLAAGAVAMVAGYTFWSFRGGSSSTGGLTGASAGLVDLPVVPALILTLLASVGMGLLFEFAVLRPLRTSPPLAKLIATLGLFLIAQAGVLIIFGQVPQAEPSILPGASVAMLGGAVPLAHFMLAGIVAVVSVLVACAYRWTNFGLSTRAAAENQASAMLAGLSPGRLSMANAVLGCLIAGGLGVLAAPVISLDTDTLPLTVVPALAAALVGRFTSVTVACAAGLVIGMGESLLFYVSTQSWFPTDQGQPLPGVKDLLVFLLIAGMMWWRSASLPGRGDLIERRLPAVPRPRRLLTPALAALVLGTVALIVLPFDFRQALMNSMIATILVLSLVLVTGFVGQVSAMQLALSGIAGLVVSHLARAGLGFPLGLVVGAVAATALSMLVAASALRVRGVPLAVFTLAAAVAMQNFIFANGTWGAGGIVGAPVPQPSLLGLDLGSGAPYHGLDGFLPSPVLGFMILAFAVLLCLLVANIRRSALGQRMLAVRSSERAAAAAGVDVRNVKLAAVGIGGFIAGVAGGLYGYNFSAVAQTRFTAVTALSLIAFAYLGGITMVSGAVLTGLITVEGVVQIALQDSIGLDGTREVLVAGVLLVLSVNLAPAGWAGGVYSLRRRWAARGAQATARHFGENAASGAEP